VAGDESDYQEIIAWLPAYTARVTVLRELRDALVDGALVVVDALRLVWRHWPALVTIFLLGLAVRNGAMWAAVLIGREHPVLASLLVPLAPLAMVTALVLMLWQAGRSARWGGPTADATPAERLALLASALVPFLTVYALQGHLEDDRNQFINESYADEFQNSDFFGGAGLDDRTLATVTSWQLGLVAVALVVRTVMDRLELAERHIAWGFSAALVEVTWLTWLAAILTSRWRDARDWVDGRVVVSELADAWHRLTGFLGPLTEPVRALGDLLARIVDGIGAIVVTPVAWLTVGAVVLAGGLQDSRRARIEEHRMVVRVRERLGSRAERLRRHLWRPDRVADLLGRRFEDLIAGLRTIAHAGVVPVLTFCLVLGLAQLAEWGSALALRAMIGPRDPETMIAFSPYLDLVTRTVYTVAVVALVAAAVDRLLSRRLQEELSAAAEAPAVTAE